MSNEELEITLRRLIEEYAGDLPYIARYWEINISQNLTEPITSLQFGHYHYERTYSTSFYKPISKIFKD
jgi:hypothetical protein